VHRAISREALADYFGADGADQDGRRVFRSNRSTFEKMARTKCSSWPVEDPGSVLVKTDEVAMLGQQLPSGSHVTTSELDHRSLRCCMASPAAVGHAPMSHDGRRERPK
jgi:hypothetical protein